MSSNSFVEVTQVETGFAANSIDSSLVEGKRVLAGTGSDLTVLVPVITIILAVKRVKKITLVLLACPQVFFVCFVLLCFSSVLLY